MTREPQTAKDQIRLFTSWGAEWFGKAKPEGCMWIAEYNGKRIPLRQEPAHVQAGV